MAFGLLIELNRGIDLYLRYYSIVDVNQQRNLSVNTIKRRKYDNHLESWTNKKKDEIHSIDFIYIVFDRLFIWFKPVWVIF